MVRREWRKVLSRILNLHGVGFFPRKIDYDLIKEKVPFCHTTEPPTLVQTKRARLQFFKLLSASCREFSRFNQLFQFDVHFQECTKYDERSKWRGKSLFGTTYLSHVTQRPRPTLVEICGCRTSRRMKLSP